MPRQRVPDPPPLSEASPEPFRIATSLGERPELQSCSDLAEAIRCVALLDARRQAVEAARDVELQRIQERAARQLQVDVAGRRLTFAEWRANLIAAIEQFVPAHKPAIFSDGKQTAGFPSGQISYKRVEPAVRLEEGVKSDDIAQRMAKRAGLPEALAALLQKFGFDGWLRVNVGLDLQAIQRRFKDGALKARHLPAGLMVTQPSEQILVKPFPQPERSESDAAPGRRARAAA